jgi:hypothetical protein
MVKTKVIKYVNVKTYNCALNMYYNTFKSIFTYTYIQYIILRAVWKVLHMLILRILLEYP